MPRLAAAVNFAQLVARASHSRLSLHYREERLRIAQRGVLVVPEELIAGGSREHVPVGDHRGCVTYGISHGILRGSIAMAHEMSEADELTLICLRINKSA